MIYPRRLTATLLKEIRMPRVVVLTGMRQTGKTTLMRQIFDSVQSDNKVFLDLENPLNRRVFEEEDYDNVMANLREFGIEPTKRCFVFLDEVQLQPAVSRVVKYLYDHYKVKFFLTGSSSFYLRNLFPESLAGRKVIYELFPLDFEEFLVFKGEKSRPSRSLSQRARGKNVISFQRLRKRYEEYLQFGGFPGVVTERSKRKEVLGDIFTSYFEKDVKTLADFREIGHLRDLTVLLANRVGSKVEISKISSELGVSRETVYAYLEFLEKTYFIFLITPFSRSLNGEVRGSRKVYLSDTGLLNYLGKTTEGAVFENAVFLNLRREGQVNYYEKYKGPEIDFIIRKRIACEAKTFGDSRDIKRLQRTAQHLGLRNFYLVTKNFLDHPRSIQAVDL